MSWTKLLEKRFFPANATVVEDVACAQCGYNLRGLKARGRCPECGRPVGDSLYLLTKPQVVSSAFTELGASYLAHGALGFGCMLSVAGIGLVWFTMLVLVAGGLVRMHSAFVLRFGAGLQHLPAVGNLATRLLVLSVIEFAALIALIVITYLALTGAGLGASGSAPTLALLAWWALTLLTACQAASLASRLGSLMDFDLIRREAIIQHVLMIVTAVASIAIVILILVASFDPAVELLFYVLLLIAGLAFFYTMLCLWHTGNAAAQSGELREDAVEIGVQSGIDHSSPASPASRPDITLDG